MPKKFVLTFYFFTAIYQTQKIINAAPHDSQDHNAIIVIPFKASDEQITKIDSFKIDGETAIKHLTSRVSAEKILRTLSNVPEFSILVEGLDVITLGDVYKAAFPKGILQSISDQYLRSPKTQDNKAVIIQPNDLEVNKSTGIVSGDKGVDTDISSESEIQYDEVNEDEPPKNNDDLKEEPITDDYVYDQPVEDRFFGDREYVTREKDEIEDDDSRGSKNIKVEDEEIINKELRNKEITKYGAKFRNWITKFLAG